MLRRTVRVSEIGIDAWQFESTISHELTIELAESVPDTAEIQVQAVDETTTNGWRFTSITVADLRAFLEDRDAAAKWMHNADDLRTRQADSRLGQSAQIEEVK